MLAIADHDLGNANFTGPAERLMQNCIGFLPTLLRLEKIWLVEKLGIDLLQINEVRNIDGMRGLDPHLLEVLVLQHNVMAALVLEAFHDLVGWNFLCIRFRHFFVPDRAKVAGTKLSKTNLLFARGRINRHRNVNQPEANAAFPSRTHLWETLFPQ